MISHWDWLESTLKFFNQDKFYKPHDFLVVSFSKLYLKSDDHMKKSTSLCVKISLMTFLHSLFVLLSALMSQFKMPFNNLVNTFPVAKS